MNVLAFDTCLGAVSAAVRWQSAAGDWLLREDYEPCTTGHAERLFPMIAEIMEGAGLEFSAIDRIAVTPGPGTFTGVRAGVSAARAFALATGRPVVGMTSLAVMARRAKLLLGAQQAGRPLAVAVDAGRGMVYLQAFDAGANQAGDAALFTHEEAAAAIGRRPVLVVGLGGCQLLLPPSATNGPKRDCPTCSRTRACLPSPLPSLSPIATVTPLYLRQPDAKPSADHALPATHRHEQSGRASAYQHPLGRTR